MLYALKVSLYGLVCFVTASFVSSRWFSNLHLLVVIGLGLLMAIVMIIVGRWLFGQKTL